MFSFNTASKEGTIKRAVEFSRLLKAGDRVALSGNLGSGKTHFVKGAVKGWGGNYKTVQSPTFNLVKTYEEAKWIIYHFDLYRLKDFDELERTGYSEMISDPRALSFVEWPEMVAETWKDFDYAVKFFHKGGNKRMILVYRRKIGNAKSRHLKKSGSTRKAGAK